MNDFRQKFGIYLINKGISQTEAAERMETSQQAISQLLTIDKPVRPTTKRKIYKAFPDFADRMEGFQEFTELGNRATKYFDQLIKNHPSFKARVESYAKDYVIGYLEGKE